MEHMSMDEGKDKGHGRNERSSGWHNPYPDCADALSSPADIPHSGCFRIKKNV
jgi:hypothetical protein